MSTVNIFEQPHPAPVKVSTGFVLRDYQQEAVDRAVEYLRAKHTHNGLLVLPTGCHAAGTRVVMFDLSTKAVEDVRVGDELMGPDGKPRFVVQLCRGREQMYRITPHRGGSPFVVNAGHILSLECTQESNVKDFPSMKHSGNRDFISVADYLNKSKSWKHLRKLHRSHAVGQRITDIRLPIEPWALGVILGDGSTLNGCVSVTTADQELSDAIFGFAEQHGCAIRVSYKPNNRAVCLHIVKAEQRRNNQYVNPVTHKLRALGVADVGCGEKAIPDQYKRGSIATRQSILAGLIDTDGHHDGLGGFDFISKSKQLADDVTFIARSLGITCSTKECEKRDQNGQGGTYHRVHLSGDTAQIPCRIERKKPAARKQIKDSHRTGFTVEPVGLDDFYGFTLEGDHLYLTDDFVVHHNSGKSLVVAGIIKALGEPTLVLQPSKEILWQNVEKFRSYGGRCGIYSASAGVKRLDDVTFATIGSVIRKLDKLERFKYVIVDECHSVNAKSEDSMYTKLIETLGVKVIGLTATPYRLSKQTDERGWTQAILKFLTRTNPRIFSHVVYYVQNGRLFADGHLSPLEYFEVEGFNRFKLQRNSTGADYTDESLAAEYEASGFRMKLVRVVNRLFTIGRRNALIFTKRVEEAEYVARNIQGCAVVSAETPAAERDRIIKGFRSGRIRAVANVGILTTGFDYPELDTVVLARPTMSLALYYQMIGRCVRPHPSKAKAMVVDMCGNLGQFGKVEDMVLSPDGKGWHIVSNGKVLTNVPFGDKFRAKR